jgi:anti-sigma B factor antagonist
MQLSVDRVGDVTVVTVGTQELDAGNAEDFRQQIAPALEGCRKLVLDLSRVRFVDSRGCGMILSCLKTLSQAGGDLKLCGVAPLVRTVFDLIRLHRICEIVETREDAVKAFQG